MVNFNIMVNRVIRDADILLLVIDARKVEESMNAELEKKARQANKKFLYVINKCDLLTKAEQDKINLPNSIQVSAMMHLSTMKLLRKIMELSKGEEAVVGVLGYPNTGKSTLINAMKGMHSAPTSSMSGYTKSLQKVRISKKIMLIDTPGVFSYARTDKSSKEHIGLVSIGAIDAEKLKDPENTVLELIDLLDGRVEKYFGVEASEDSFETLEKIALKKNIIKKGGVPDTTQMAKSIITLCQRGLIK